MGTLSVMPKKEKKIDLFYPPPLPILTVDGSIFPADSFFSPLFRDRRRDISEGLKDLQCRTLIFVGESSPFHSEALHMFSELDERRTALVEV